MWAEVAEVAEGMLDRVVRVVETMRTIPRTQFRNARESVRRLLPRAKLSSTRQLTRAKSSRGGL
jgi:hypothetical protein